MRRGQSNLLSFMEINTNMNASGVNGLIPRGPSAPAPKPAPDTVSFTGTDGVEAALQGLPESRPEAVALAKLLINDPGYPSPEMVKHLSQFLASKLQSENQ